MSEMHGAVRVGTIGWTYDAVTKGEQIRVRVTGRGMIGDIDVITIETIARKGGNYVDAMLTFDLMPETSEQTQARWKTDEYTTIGTYPAFEQDDPVESFIAANGDTIETRLVNGQRIGRTITATRP